MVDNVFGDIVLQGIRHVFFEALDRAREGDHRLDPISSNGNLQTGVRGGKAALNPAGCCVRECK